jgi:hypothetical protein
MYIFAEDDPSIGETIAPTVTTMEDANGNLASVYQMTEGPSKKSLLIQPDGAPSGLFRTEQIIEFTKDRDGTGRDELIANVEWQISQNFPPEYTWNF